MKHVTLHVSHVRGAEGHGSAVTILRIITAYGKALARLCLGYDCSQLRIEAGQGGICDRSGVTLTRAQIGYSRCIDITASREITALRTGLQNLFNDAQKQ